jgi:aspartyl-tRNA(Asn)/glutamyl-tRNA(Gln) amidotransferase subunit B
MGDITAYLKNEKLAIAEIPFQPQDLAELLALIDAGTISGKIAKDILPELLANGGSPTKLVESKGLIQISDTGAIDRAIDAVLAANPKELEQYRAGKTKLLGFFVGKVMKETGGRADPKLTNELLVAKLNA